MTTTLSTTRPRMLNIPHKGLRNALAHFSLLVGNTDYRDLFAVNQLHKIGSEVFAMLNEHAETENLFSLAELEIRCPGAGRHNLEDHEVIEQQQAELEQALNNLHSLVRAGVNASAEGEAFFRQLGHFYSEYQKHMLEEEEETQVLMWEYFSDEELLDMHRRIVAHLKPELMLIWVKWSAPAQSHPDRTAWIRSMQAGAPAPFFEKVLEVLRSALSPLQMEMLMAELSLN